MASEQGYITFAIDRDNDDTNIKAAWTLAVSLKINDPLRETCLVVENFKDLPTKYEDAFDYIVELPYGNTDVGYDSTDLNLWQLYYCSPFEQSIYINPHTVAVDNIVSLWENIVNYDIVFPANMLAFRHNIANYKTKFRPQIKNDFEVFGADVFAFKRNENGANFFKMVDIVFQNWRDVYREYVKDGRPNTFDTALAFSLAAHLLGEQVSQDVLEYIDFHFDNFEIKHDDEDIADWLDNVNIWFSNVTQIKVNNHRQTGLFVYHDPTIITDQFLHDLRNHYNKTKIRHSN